MTNKDALYKSMLKGTIVCIEDDIVCGVMDINDEKEITEFISNSITKLVNIDAIDFITETRLRGDITYKVIKDTFNNA